MDCIRVSTGELDEGERYFGNYIEAVQLQGSGVNACRQACVSSQNCTAWEYTPDQKCLTTTSLGDNGPQIRPAPNGTRAGIIECKASPNILNLILWIIILGSILVLVWFFMAKFDKSSLPRFHFASQN